MADQIDYKIHESTMDLIETSLDPGEAIVAETGAMVSMDANIEMEPIFGDGSEKEKGVFGKIFGSGKRMMTGEGLFMTKLENTGDEKANALLSPGGAGAKVIPINLSKLETAMMCNRGQFIGAARGTNIDMGVRFKPFSSLVGSAELVTHKLDGDGYVFLKSSGPAFTTYLDEGQTIKIDQHSLVGFQESVSYNITMVKGVKSMFFSGEGLVLYEMTGPGLVILQGYDNAILTEDEVASVRSMIK